jgi:type I restriction enzyme S subunit
LIPELLQIYLNTPQVQDVLAKASGSTAQPHLYLGDLRALPVVLPPLTEQRRIVAEVERRLSVVQELEGTLAVNLARAERLRQAILKRAFEGKL